MSSKPTVAVLGLGTMGHPFAANLVKGGFTTWVWNRSADKADDLVEAGAHRAATAAEAAANADVVISILSTPDVTKEVLFGEDGALAAMQEGSVLAQMGTIGIEATDELIDRIGQEYPGVVFIDAPVSGSKVPAEQATLLVLASGDQERAPAVEPVFNTIGKGAKWLGEAGAGSRMKLVVNSWLIMLMEGTIESALLAEKLGFTTDDFWGVLDGGPLAAPYMKLKLAKIKEANFSTEMALDWGIKDGLLAMDASDASQLPSLASSVDTWKAASNSGLGEEDISSVAQYLKNQ